VRNLHLLFCVRHNGTSHPRHRPTVVRKSNLSAILSAAINLTRDGLMFISQSQIPPSDGVARLRCQKRRQFRRQEISS